MGQLLHGGVDHGVVEVVRRFAFLQELHELVGGEFHAFRFLLFHLLLELVAGQWHAGLFVGEVTVELGFGDKHEGVAGLVAYNDGEIIAFIVPDREDAVEAVYEFADVQSLVYVESVGAFLEDVFVMFVDVDEFQIVDAFTEYIGVRGVLGVEDDTISILHLGGVDDHVFSALRLVHCCSPSWPAVGSCTCGIRR